MPEFTVGTALISSREYENNLGQHAMLISELLKGDATRKRVLFPSKQSTVVKERRRSSNVIIFKDNADIVFLHHRLDLLSDSGRCKDRGNGMTEAVCFRLMG